MTVAKGAITKANQQINVNLDIIGDRHQDKYDKEKIGLGIYRVAGEPQITVDAGRQTAEVFILDDDKVLISLTGLGATPVSEGIGTLTPQIVRSIGSERHLKVRVTTADGTARSASPNGHVRDYTPIAQNVTFPADASGPKSVPIALNIVNDLRQDEQNIENFSVNLAALSATAGYTIAQPTNLVAIRDNDQIVLDMPSSIEINESAGTPTDIVVQARLNGQDTPQGAIVSERNLRLNLRTVGVGASNVVTARGQAGTEAAPYAQDFQPFEAQPAKILGVMPSVNDQPAQASVTVFNDQVLDERDSETFDIVAFRPATTAPDYTLGNSKTVATITDDDLPVLGLNVRSAGPVTEGNKAFFEVALEGVSAIERGLRLNLSGRAMGASASEFRIDRPLQFLPAFSNSLNFPVSTFDDTALDSTELELFAVNLQDVQPQDRLKDLRYRVKAEAAEAYSQIQDDEIAVLNLITVSNASEAKEGAEGSKFSYHFQLVPTAPSVSTINRKPARTIERNLNIGVRLNVVAESARTTSGQASILDFENGAELSGSVTQLQMLAGQTTTNSTFDAVVKDDSVLDTSILENFTVVASDVGATEADFYEFRTASVAGRIRDNDTARLKIITTGTDDTPVTGLNEGDEANVKVALDTSSGVDTIERDLAPTFTTTSNTAVAGTDFTAINSDLVIPALQTETATQKLVITDDRVLESQEALSLSVASSAGEFGAVSTPINIVDNETLYLKLTQDPASTNTLEGIKQKFVVAIDTTASGENVAEATEVDVNVNYNVLVGGDYAASSKDFGANALSGTVTIFAGQQNTNFLVRPRTDNMQDSLEVESFGVKVSSDKASNASDPIVASSIQDEADDAPTITIQRVTGFGRQIPESADDVTFQVVQVRNVGTERVLKFNVQSAASSVNGQASAADFKDDALLVQTITYDPGAPAAQRGIFTISVKEDTLLEDDEVFFVQAAKPAGATDAEKDYVLTDANISHTIVDNDNLFLALERVSGTGPIVEGSNATYRLVTTAGSGAASTAGKTIAITVAVGPGSTNPVSADDFNGSTYPTQQVTINAGDTLTPGTVLLPNFVVNARADGTQEASEIENFTITATSPETAPATIDGSIQDSNPLTLVWERVSGIGPISEGSGATYRLVAGPGSAPTASTTFTITVAVGPGTTNSVTAGDFNGNVFPSQDVTVNAGDSTAPGTVLVPNFVVNARVDGIQDSFEVENFTIAATSPQTDPATINGSIQDAANEQPSLRLVRVDSNGNPIASNPAIVAGGTAYYKVITATGSIATERELKVVMVIDLADPRSEATAADFTSPTNSGPVTVGTVFSVTTAAGAGTASANGEDFVIKATVPASAATEEKDYTFSTDEVLSTITSSNMLGSGASSSAPKPSGGNS